MQVVSRKTGDDIKALLISQGGLCNACKCDISTSYHVDHVIALARGGTNWPDNLQLLCPTL
jgi:5-methylcytosine-specific restriction endonuclease McrA